jgi:hypothetical protein
VGNNSGNKLRLLTIPIDDSADVPVRETPAAYGIAIEGRVTWFPKSQIQEFKQSDSEISFWCPNWLVVEKTVEIFVDTSYEPSLFD